MPTRLTRPVTRVVIIEEKYREPVEYVVELGRTALRLRPLGARRGGPAEVVVTYGSAYNRALAARAVPTPKKRRGRYA